MEIIRTDIPDLYIIKPKVFGDARGYFLETWRDEWLKKLDMDIKFIQANESRSKQGVVRGLHYQLAPYSQSKLVRVIKGKVLDVAVDIRKGSPTYGKYHAVELSEDNKMQFLIPQGFAHGFSVLSEYAVFTYKCDNYYHPEAERGIDLHDSSLKIDWKVDMEKAVISDKDKNNPLFKDAETNFVYGQ